MVDKIITAILIIFIVFMSYQCYKAKQFSDRIDQWLQQKTK